MQAETKGKVLSVIGNSMSKGMDVAECSVYASIKWTSACLRDKERKIFWGQTMQFLNALLRTMTCLLWVRGKLFKQGSACTGRLRREAGQTSSLLLESVAWSFVPFRTFGLDLKSLFILQLLPTIQLDRDSVLRQIPLLHQSLKP